MTALFRKTSLLVVTTAALVSYAGAQTQPSAVPVPMTKGLIGLAANATTTTVCAASILTTDGSSYGDGCPGTQARVSSPQGAAVDSYGNVYWSDYSNRQVRVLYMGGTQLAAAITAANSGYVISSTRSAPAPAPVAGNVYTLSGVGNNTPTITAYTVAGNPCANYAATGQPSGLNVYGDGCPAASAPVGPRDVKTDSDGNVFIIDYTNARLRVFCVNCAVGTMAQKLITLENPAVTTPANGAMYTLIGFSGVTGGGGYRDAMIGYNTAANTATTAGSSSAPLAIALLRAPTGLAISANDDIYVADNMNNALRVLYNGGTAAKAILAAEGTTPTLGYVYTVGGAGCKSADSMHTGTSASANSCLTTTGSDTPALANTVGTGVVWSTYLDSNNNIYYTDATNNRVKVIYGGVANPLSINGTLQVGYTYSFAGQGTGAAGAQNGVAPSAIVLGSAQGVGGDAYGNIFLADYGTGSLYEVSSETGIAYLLGGTNGVATPVANAACNGVAAGPVMTDASYDGCPATQVKFSGPRGEIVADTAGNLYLGDSVGVLVREFSYGLTFPATAVGSSASAQPYAFTFLSPITLPSRGIAPASDFSDGGNSTCTAGAFVQGATCVQYVKFTPSQGSERLGAVTVSTSAGVIGAIDIGGLGNGSQLLAWPGTVTTAASGYTASGIAVGSDGSVYVADSASGKATRVSGSATTTLLTGLTKPSGIAVDGAGNVYVADAGGNTLREVPVVGAAFTLSTAVSAPSQLATGPDGTLYVADTGNNRVLAFAPNSATPRVLAFTGLASPKAVAVDAAGTVYTNNGATIAILTVAGVQSSRAAINNIAWLAVDAGGTVYASTGGSSVTAFSPIGSSPVAYTGTSVAGLALDGAGGLYVADTGVSGVAKSQGTAGYYKFPTVSGSTTISLVSAGTQSVPSTSYTSTNTTDYTVAPATSIGCSGALASGSTCNYAATYSQVTLGAPTDTLTFNGGITFTLASISLTPAVVVSALPSSIVYGNTVTLSASVYGPGNTGGIVTFYASGTKVGTGTADSNGAASFTYKPAVGTYTISADYTPAGASSASVSSKASALVTVTAATPGLAFTLTPGAGYTTTSFTATATLTATGGSPTGSVAFFSGSTQVGTGTVNASGMAFATFTSLVVGTDCITAQYSGDSNYNKLTTACTNVVVAAGFGVTATSTALAFQSGYQQAQSFLNIATGGRTDTLTFACSGLPAKVQCAFSPSSVTLAGGSATVQVQMLVANSGATYSDVRHVALTRGPGIALASLSALGLCLFGTRRRRLPALLAVAVLVLAGAATMTGCAGQSPVTLQQSSGSYNFNVTVNSGSTTLQTIPFTLTIP